MKAALAPVGAVVVDSYPYSVGGTAQHARGLAAAGVDALVGYLGPMTPARLGYLLEAGLAYMPVTVAGAYKNGAADEIARLKALGIPAGVTVWLDLESESRDPAVVIAEINAWARAIATEGWQPGLYVGVPQPLTSDELWSLATVRYWQGMGSTRDRRSALAEPTRCGWCMTQIFPSMTVGGVLIDWNMIGQDYLRRLPSWAVA